MSVHVEVLGGVRDDYGRRFCSHECADAYDTFERASEGW